MPAGAIEQDHGMAAGCDVAADLSQMQAHRRTVGSWEDERDAGIARGRRTIGPAPPHRYAPADRGQSADRCFRQLDPIALLVKANLRRATLWSRTSVKSRSFKKRRQNHGDEGDGIIAFSTAKRERSGRKA
jgi:hypothetical protein